MVLILLPDFKRDPGTPEMSMDLNLRDLFVVPRRLWSKVPSSHQHQPLEHPVTNIIVSWTGQQRCETEGECVRAVWELQERYQSMGQDIPYNFVVGGDSTVYECRGWFAKPAPCERHPDLVGSAMEIAHVGIREADSRRPMPGMAKAVVDLCEYGMKMGYVEEQPEFLPDYVMFFGVDITEEQKKNLLEWELEEELKKPECVNVDIPDLYN